MDRTLTGFALAFMVILLVAFFYNEYREGYASRSPYYAYYSGQSASVYGSYNGYNQGTYNPPFNTYYYGGSSYRMPMSFSECAAMGFPVGESYPRQCFTQGNTFTENVTTYTNTSQTSNFYSGSSNTYSY